MPTKIPFWATVGAAYRFVFSDPGRVLRASAVWIAVEEAPGVWRRSWRRGEGNAWRLAASWLLCGGPGAVLGFAIIIGQRVLGDVGGSVTAILALQFILFAIFYFVHFYGIAVAISFLSMSYRHLTRAES